MSMRWIILFALACGLFVFPISAEEAPLEKGSTFRMRPAIKVLLEDLHNQARAGDVGRTGQAVLKKELEKCGAMVDSTLEVMSADLALPRRLTAEFLSRYEVVISNSQYLGRSIGPGSGVPMRSGPPPAIMNAFLKDEISALQTYVERGGILFVTSGSSLATGNGPLFYNPMLKDFGVRFMVDPSRTMAPEAPLVSGVDHPLVSDLREVIPIFPARLEVTNKTAKTLFELDGHPLTVVIPHGKGSLIVAGGGGGWLNEGLERKSPDLQKPNVRFLQNLVNWATDQLEARSTAAPAANPPVGK